MHLCAVFEVRFEGRPIPHFGSALWDQLWDQRSVLLLLALVEYVHVAMRPLLQPLEVPSYDRMSGEEGISEKRPRWLRLMGTLNAIEQIYRIYHVYNYGHLFLASERLVGSSL